MDHRLVSAPARPAAARSPLPWRRRMLAALIGSGAAPGAARRLRRLSRSQSSSESRRPRLPPAPKPAEAPAPQGQPQAQAGDQPQLIFSPWTKFCLKGQEANAKQVCFTGKDGRVESGIPAVAAVLIEPEGEPKKVFRITLPLGMSIQPGTRMMVDKEQPMTGRYVICFNNGCMADFEASAELIGKLKKGQGLVLQGINGAGQPHEPTWCRSRISPRRTRARRPIRRSSRRSRSSCRTSCRSGPRRRARSSRASRLLRRDNGSSSR